jgi:hypothetical protein
LMHGPLYFEQPLLERYGYSKRPRMQPFRSGVKFSADVAIWPIKLWKVPPHLRIAESEFGSSMHVPSEDPHEAVHSEDFSIRDEQSDENVPHPDVPVGSSYHGGGVDEFVPIQREGPHDIGDPDRLMPELPPLPRGDL